MLLAINDIILLIIVMVVMVRPFEANEAFGRANKAIEPFAIAEGHDCIAGPMQDEHWSRDLGDALVGAELVPHQPPHR